MKHDLYLVIDIGGTKILLVVFDDAGNILDRKKLSTPEKPLPDQLVSFIIDELSEMELKSPTLVMKDIVSVGICFAGFIEHHQKLVHQAPNLGWKEPVPLAALFEQQLNRPVIIENDASAAVIGEVYYGAARGHQDAIYITYSTGIGGGLFLDGQLYRGNTGFAGEIGHTKFFGKGRICNCGGDNCLETWASGKGIAKSAAELWEPADLGYDELTSAIVFQEAASGNQPAELMLKEAINAFGVGLANLINILNPSCLVIGGGIIAAHPELLAELKMVIHYNAIRPVLEISKIQVLQAELGTDSGVWGMFALLSGLAVND